MMEYISNKTMRKFESGSEPGTVEWVQECGNYTRLLFYSLADLQVKGSKMTDLEEELASEQIHYLIKRWVSEAGTKMWPDMTHFEIAGIMHSSPTYRDGDKIVMYNQNDARVWCFCADSDPEQIAELWQHNGAITKDVWQKAIFT